MRETRSRILSVLLALALLLSAVPEALAAESTTAATMQLMKKEGSVAVSNSSGRSISLIEKMRLYNGYHVETEEASYAWINLDSSKLTKLDAVSEMEVRKNGKKLEILLNEGNIFFNVTEPLDDGESLNIRTSTLVVGIRGTCGWVKVIDQWNSQVYVLEGTVEVTVTDPVTGETKTETVSAGETARGVVYPQDHTGDKCEIIRDRYHEEDVEGFVLPEVTPDKDLCDDIFEDTGLDLRDLTEDEVQERLRQDQEDVRKKQEVIDRLIEEQDNNISTTPVWPDPVPDGPAPEPVTSPGSTGAGSYNPPSAGSSSVTLTMPVDAGTVSEHLNRSGVSGVVLQPGTAQTRSSTINLLEVDSPISVPAGKFLTLQSGVAIDVLAGQSMQIAGTVTVGGGFHNAGSVSVSGAVTVNGTLTQDGTLTPGGNSPSIRARSIVLNAGVSGWKVSDTADSAGYYSLVREQPSVITITFNSNGGSAVSPVTGAPGALASLPTPTRAGYTFVGWYTALTGGTQVTDSYVFTQDTTVYARWTADSSASVTWRLDGTTLYIEGSGPMEFEGMGRQPWAGNASRITAVIIENGVTSISTGVFYEHTNLTRVTIPASVSSIDGQAFMNCGSLTGITIPNGVNSIGDYAFSGCASLANVTIPDSVASMGGNVFYDCTSLTSVTVPDSVTSFGRYMFRNCSGLVRAVLPSRLTTIDGTFSGCGSLTNVTIPGSVTSLGAYAFNNCGSLASITIPASVKTISPLAFDGCNGLTDVYYNSTRAEWDAITIGAYNDPLLNATLHCADDASDVTWRIDGTTLYIEGSGPMEDYSLSTSNRPPWFDSRTSIKTVIIEDGITTIGEYSFYYFTSLTSVEIPDSVTSIGNRAFSQCNSLTSVVIPNGVTSIGMETFTGCISLTEITIPDSVRMIGSHAFMDCEVLTSVVIPDGVATISDNVFYNCYRLTSVTIPDSVTEIGNYVFTGCRSLASVTIPNRVTSIGRQAFYSCTSLTSVTIPDSVTTIDQLAFYGCSALTSITIPDGVTSLGYGVFSGCSSLTSVAIPDTFTAVVEQMFANCHSLTEVTIPSSVTSIGANAFNSCNSLTDVYYGGTKTQWDAITIGSSNDPLLNATFHFNEESEGPVTGTAGNLNWEYTPATRTLRIWGSGAMDNYAATASPAVYAPWNDYQAEIEHVVVESGVTTIGNCAFWEYPALTDAQLPSGITRIGSGAFYKCAALTNAPIPSGVTTILQAAFSGCESITSVTVPDTVTSLGHDAFSSCTALADVTLSKNLTVIDNSTFSHCTSLKEITVPDSVTELKNGAFLVSGLTSLTLPSGLTTIGPNVFNGCTSLTDVYYGGTKTQWDAITIGSSNDPLLSATLHCTGEDEVVASGENWRIAGTTLYIEGAGPMDDYTGTASIPWYEFRTIIESVVIENGVTTIGSSAFINCSVLTDITIPGSITAIGYSAFTGCSSLTDITIPDTVTSIGGGIFYDCSSLETVTILSELTSVPTSMFSGCSGLTSVTMPSTVTSIGANAFFGCSSLPSITIPAGVTTIDNGAFYHCDALADVYFNGPRAQWNAVIIGSNNDPLLNAAIHCLDDGTDSPGGDVTWRLDGGTLYIEGSGEMETIEGYTGASAGRPWNEDAGTIREIIIADGVTTIGSYAFESCRALTSVTIPDSVTRIGYAAFQSCTSLTNVTIPEGVTRMRWGAFRYSGLTSVTVPASLSDVEAMPFAGCTSLAEIAVDPANPSYKAVDGVLYSMNGATLVQYPAGKSDTSYTVPDGVIEVSSMAFYNCDNLTSVTIPDSVTSIEMMAFSGCSNLTNVYYTGTEEQWSAITIGETNDPLTTAVIHYGSPATQSVVNAAAPGYTDVSDKDWYAEAVAYCREHGLMNGTSATEFSPNGTLTRAMMVTVLHRLAGTPAADAAAAFRDVEAGQWYTDAIAWASGQGIVQGYDGVTFGVNDPVTHEQVGLILQRYSGDLSVKVYGADAPEAPATRAEIAATLMDYAEGQLAPGSLSTFSAMNILCAPSGLALDRDGSLLAADLYHKQIWRVVNRASTSYAGGSSVQDLYGQPVGGYNDAALNESFFKEPWAIAPFLDGWAVSDTENNVVRLIQGGSVRTLNGATSEKLTVTDLGVAFDHPTGLASDSSGNLYVSDTFSGAVRKITPEGGVSTVAKDLSEPMGLCWKNGVLYIAETGANRIVKVENGKVTAVAGNGADGFTDGAAEKAAFSAPQGVTVGDDGSVYVSDTGNGAIRLVRNGQVTALTARDASQPQSGLTSPRGLLLQGDRLYICDSFARKIFVLRLG